ncbi:MAG: signal peptidase II [Clostridia bacterium]|nr:signal peptidase II [Clostridia bacterium]
MVLYLLLAALMVAADQLIKYWTVTVLQPIGSIPILQDVFHLTYVENTGAAFSMLEGRQGFFILVTLAAFGFMAYLYRTGMIKGVLGNLCVSFILGGAVGNFIDRLRLGYVIDLFDFCLIDFPVFNFADICITIGGILFVWLAFLDYKAEVEAEKARKLAQQQAAAQAVQEEQEQA